MLTARTLMVPKPVPVALDGGQRASMKVTHAKTSTNAKKAPTIVLYMLLARIIPEAGLAYVSQVIVEMVSTVLMLTNAPTVPTNACPFLLVSTTRTT